MANVNPDIRKHYNMASPKTADYYDANAGTTSIEEITEVELHRETLRLLRDDDSRLSHLCICEKNSVGESGECHPGSNEELGWLGHFAKKSTHLDEFTFYGNRSSKGVFEHCSKQSVHRFIEDLGKCNYIRKMNFLDTDLSDIIYKLVSVMKHKNITHWVTNECELGVPEAHFMFNTFRGMKNLEVLSLGCNDFGDGYGLGDDIAAGCIPSLAACTAIRDLDLSGLDLSTNSCAALSAVFPRMASLHELILDENSIDDNCVEVLLQGLAECEHLHSLKLSQNRISDNGLALLIQRLPASASSLDLYDNEVALARQLSLLRFKELRIPCNPLSTAGPGVIATSLANPECQLEVLELLFITNEELAILAESLRNNQRLVQMGFALFNSNITRTGLDIFSSILCDTASIDATHGSNHALRKLGEESIASAIIPNNIKMLLELNSDEDKCRVAANKILRTHRHLDMRPLFNMELDLLPHVVAWLERFAECRLDLKLSSMFEFVRAMPQEVIGGVGGKKKGKKRRRNSP